MISKLLERFARWRNRCRSCEADGIDKSLLGHFPNLGDPRRFKTVAEYQCKKCGSLWVLPDQSGMLQKVHRRELLDAWKSLSRAPTEAQQAALTRIKGATDPRRTDVHFPCQVLMPDGTQVARALVVATTGNCFGKDPFGPRVELLGEAHHLSPSPFALPHAVRAATLAAEEKSMGYAPVDVRDAHGNRYTLTTPMHFFERDGVLGPEISLDDAKTRGRIEVVADKVGLVLVCDPFQHPRPT